jgi:hypothetical protein
MRTRVIVAVAFALIPAAANAQQGSATSNRLMFDPTELRGSDGRKLAPQPATTTTTGQSTAPQPAPRQVATPQPQPQAVPAAAPKPAARATASAPPRPARRPAQAGNTIADTPTGSTRTPDRPVPREQAPALGRLSLPEGTLGYESRTQMQTYDLSDGRRVPGYDNIQRNDSSYFGLSLRMPTGISPAYTRDHGAN